MASVREGFAKKWWGLLLRGILAIAFGLTAFLLPDVTLLMLALLYGAYALVDGLVSTWFGRISRSWWLVLFGLLGIGVGIYTLYLPINTATAMLYMIAAWILFRGVIEIVTAIRLRTEIRNEWSLLIAGLFSIGMALLLFARPGAGALAVVWLVGAYALVSGVLLIKLALRVRRLPQRLDKFADAA